MIGGMLKKLQTKLKDTKTVAGNVTQAQEQQQPLTKEQIIKNTSMAPKPPGTPVNTSGRPPVAPTEPPPQASNLSGEVKPLDVIAPSRTGAPDPWSKGGNKQASAPIRMVQETIAKAGQAFTRMQDPWNDRYPLEGTAKQRMDELAKLDRRSFKTAVMFNEEDGKISKGLADRYRREYDRRRR